MNDQTSKLELYHFIQTALNDITTLENIAEPIALDEYQEKQQQGLVIPPTTSREGIPFDPATFIPSRCTVPLAMVCFSVLDFIGKIIGLNIIGKETHMTNEFTQHARSFFKKLANRFELESSASAAKLESIYRNAVMHAYLPVTTNGIGYSVTYSHKIDQEVLFDDWTYPKETTLNVKLLARIVRDGLERLRMLIDTEDYIIENYAITLNAIARKSKDKL